MWRESLHAGYSEAASDSSTSTEPRRSCSSRYSTTWARTVSHGVRRRTYRGIFGSLARRSSRRRLGSVSSACSSSTNRAGRGVRRDTSSQTGRRWNMYCIATCSRRRTCRILGTTSTSSTCRYTGLEGKETHVGRSSELQSSHECSSRIGQLADRCLPGEGAQDEVALGARQHIHTHLANQRGHLHYRLMTAAMAERSRSSAGRRRRRGWAGARGESSTRGRNVV